MSMDASLVTAFCALVAAILGWQQYSRLRHNPRRLPLPPGPRRLPVIGNLLDIPLKNQFLVFDEWHRLYGDVVYVEAAGQRLLFLGSTRVVNDLLERRSAKYSTRPRLVMINELMGAADMQFSMMPYGEKWRSRRRAFHPYFHPGAVDQWDSAQRYEIDALLRRLLAEPAGFEAHARLTFGALIMRIVYGIVVTGHDDEYITNAENALRGLSDAVPGAFLVDFIPAMKFIPGWVPGAGFQKKGADVRKALTKLAFEPFDAVKRAVATGNARDCVLTRMLAEIPDGPETQQLEVIARDSCAMAYAAAGDTSVSAISSFFLAMTTYPDVQKKAQEELDAVLGLTRLPQYSDHLKLPYIDAIVLEVLRWQPVLPLAIPHCTGEDDEYNGWFIPAGTTVFGNTWTILRNPEVYSEPDLFKPERFLRANADGKLEIDPSVQDPHIAAFGYGRRICQGRFLADRSLFGIVASVLSVFSITPIVDEHGQPVPPKVEMAEGFLSRPVEYECVIKPRSDRAEGLVRATAGEDNMQYGSCAHAGFASCAGMH